MKDAEVLICRLCMRCYFYIYFFYLSLHMHTDGFEIPITSMSHDSSFNSASFTFSDDMRHSAVQLIRNLLDEETASQLGSDDTRDRDSVTSVSDLPATNSRSSGTRKGTLGGGTGGGASGNRSSSTDSATGSGISISGSKIALPLPPPRGQSQSQSQSQQYLTMGDRRRAERMERLSVVNSTDYRAKQWRPVRSRVGTGNVAYCPQVPAMHSGTVRANVLMGCGMDLLRYQKVLQGCCLTQDIEVRQAVVHICWSHDYYYCFYYCFYYCLSSSIAILVLLLHILVSFICCCIIFENVAVSSPRNCIVSCCIVVWHMGKRGLDRSRCRRQ
jgi:hypothetical protein